MLKKLLTVILFISVLLMNAQTETVPAVTVGSTVDYTNAPFVAQASTSHSQTIYYPDQLQFTGTITSLSYFMAFTGVSWQNNGNYIIRIGTTNKEEFLPGDSFIPASELTEVFNSGTVTTNQLEMIFVFTQPFFYDGQSNLVIDVEETMPGSTTSALAGFTGNENFNNPPTRCMIRIGSSILYENVFPKTRFSGTLERCRSVSPANFTNLSPSSVSAQWSNPHNIPAFRYNINMYGEPIPDTYEITTETSIILENLTPATRYSLNRKADCDLAPSNYSSQQFITRPNALTVPSEITFDGANGHNYLLNSGYYGASELSPLAGANGSANGILFRGPSNYEASWDWNENGDPFVSNSDFIITTTFSIDLTGYTGNPVFKFDLRQSQQSYFRVKVDGYTTDFVYTAVTPSSDEFNTVTIDLSDKTGTAFDIVMEHISKSTPTTNPTLRTAFVDNVKLEEASCPVPTNLTATADEDSITLNWDSLSSQWQVAFVHHDQSPPINGIPVTTVPYTIEDLSVATSYDVYVRSACATGSSAWIKIIKSTLPLPVQVPYEETFNNGTLNNNVAPQYNQMSRGIYFTPLTPYVAVMLQKDRGLPWSGENLTTEIQAWDDNREFVTGLKFRVDATNLLTLQAVVRLKQQYRFSDKTSWYRIVINGQQFGPSRNPSQMSNEPYVNLTYDLSEYVGQIVDITLEHCGRYTGNYLQGGAMDITRIDNVIFTGDINPAACQITAPALPDVAAQCSIAFNELTAPVIADECGNTITGTTDTLIFPVTEQGTTPITWTFTNSTYSITQTQNIVIDDTVAPSPMNLPQISAYCQLDVQDITAPVAYDECMGEITGTTLTEFPITTPGASQITWMFNDNNGNVTTIEQEVNIYDNFIPVLLEETLPAIVSQCEVTAEDVEAPFAIDDCTGTIVGVTDTQFPISGQGTHLIAWVYTDNYSNVLTQSQVVIIEDTEDPLLQLQNSFVQVNETGTATITGDIFDNGSTDNCGQIASWTVSPDNFNCSSLGTHTVTVTAIDANGNSTSATAHVTVTDPENFCSTAGSENFKEEHFILYPNPAKDAIYIKNTPETIKNIIIYTTLGQELYRSAVTEDTGNYKVPLNKIATGLYILTIETDSGLFNRQFIKN